MYLLDLTIGKGRVAYLLKQSRPSKTKRKSQKQYQANLSLLRKEERKEEQKKQSVRKKYLPSRKGSDDMNVDVRKDQRIFDSSQYDNDASPTDKISKIDRDILF